MSADTPSLQVELDLERLCRKLEELLREQERLKMQNRDLLQKQDQLMSERAVLLSKNEEARARVDAMIGRLKSMEEPR